MEEIQNMSDVAAVKALSRVVREWSNRRGFEALVVVLQARQQVGAAFDKMPSWAREAPQASPEAGEFARKMLSALVGGDDDEVASWSRAAVKSEFEAAAHVLDPVSLSILGGIFIGSILAARVKRIGSATFYHGIPKELGDLMKAGAGVAVPSQK
jgi:hypothetical protein